MKYQNFELSIRVLKYISDRPKCSIPQIRDKFTIRHSNPPTREKKDLYKVISYLHNFRFINKIRNEKISSGGAHYYLETTKKGQIKILSLREVFHDILEDYSVLEEKKKILKKLEEEEIKVLEQLEENQIIALAQLERKKILKVLEEKKSKVEDLSLEFSRYSHKVLEDFIKDILNEISNKGILKKVRVNDIIAYSHRRLQSRVATLIDKLI